MNSTEELVEVVLPFGGSVLVARRCDRSRREVS